MLKMYQVGAHKGSEPALWEENWGKSDFERVLSFCEIDPLFPLFERYAKPGSLMLEGGCGVGQYVVYYSSRGVNVVGLDFARDTLTSLQKRTPGLRLCVGDVAALPFADETFDIYYSGGVVEHFEEGPDHAILEARRVLRPDGILLISVPYLSLLRRLLSPFRQKSWQSVERAATDSHRNDQQFFQYVYTQNEFESILSKVGLQVLEARGYGILWGLYDIALVEALVTQSSGHHLSSDASSRSTEISSQSESTPKLAGEAANSRNVRGIMQRLIVSEDDTVPLAGFGVRLMRRFCANMMMYVCKRK
jgi:SAM-dependent methyltransferase